MANVDIVLRTIDKTTTGVKGAIGSFTELSSVIGLLERGAQVATQVLKQTIGAAVEYSNQVRNLQLVSGQTAEESSRMIQVFDDFKLNIDSLTPAIRKMTSEGLEPNLETIAKLADEYNALSTPLEKNTFLIDKFGRAGLEMAEILSQGGDAIRERAAAVQDSLILDQRAVDAARAYEFALDDLNDSATGLKIQLGNALIPVLIEVSNALTESLGVWDKNIQQIDRYIQVTEHNKAILEDAIELFKNMNEGINNSWEAWQRLPPEVKQYYIEQAKANAEAESGTGELHGLADKYARVGSEAGNAASGVTEFNDAFSNEQQLGFILNFQTRSEDFEKTKADILEKMRNLKDEIIAAQASGDVEALPGLREDMVGLTNDLNANEAAFKQWQKQAVFSLIQAKMAADGLDDKEFSQLLGIGQDLGVLDPEVVAQAQGLMDTISGVETSGLDQAVSDIKYLVSQDGRTIKVFVEQTITTTTEGTTGDAPKQSSSTTTFINYGDIYPQTLGAGDVLAELRG